MTLNLDTYHPPPQQSTHLKQTYDMHGWEGAEVHYSSYCTPSSLSWMPLFAVVVGLTSLWVPPLTAWPFALPGTLDWHGGIDGLGCSPCQCKDAVLFTRFRLEGSSHSFLRNRSGTRSPCHRPTEWLKDALFRLNTFHGTSKYTLKETLEVYIATTKTSIRRRRKKTNILCVWRETQSEWEHR